MKKKIHIVAASIIFFILGSFAFTSKAEGNRIEINDKNFPDEFFREYVYNEFDGNKDWLLSPGEISLVQTINVKSNNSCASLKGIEHFSELRSLKASLSYADNLNLESNTKLLTVEINALGIDELSFSGCSNLKELRAEKCGIKNISLRDCRRLEKLYCQSNSLEELDLKDCDMLIYLNCNANQLSELIVTDKPYLEEITCSFNKLTTVRLDNCNHLRKLNIENNLLETIDLDNVLMLESLLCCDNKLTVLNVTNLKYLTTLDCHNNKLMDLNLKNNKVLYDLNVSNNCMMCFDISQNRLLLHGEVNFGDQQVTFVSKDLESIDFSTIEGLEFARLSEWEGGKLEGTVFYLDFGETGAYTYKWSIHKMRVYFTLAYPHILNKHEGTKPTCGTDGNKEYYFCNHCDKYYYDAEGKREITNLNDIILLKTGKHNYVSRVTEGTFTKNGKISEICKVCEDEKNIKKIAAIKKVKLQKCVYDGKEKKPQATLIDSNGKEIYGCFYSVKYSKAPIKVGKYSLKVTLKGLYRGEKTVSYTIQPKNTKIKNIKAGQKTFTLQWDKVTTQTDGYEIQYSMSNKFTNSNTKTVRIKKDTTTSKTLKKLKAKKKYYVRIRTYKKVNGKTYYSDWSNTKSVVTK